MIKRKNSIIAAVMASLTICACMFASPTQANALTFKDDGVVSVGSKDYEQSVAEGLIDPNYHSIYEGGKFWYERDKDGNVTEASRKKALIHTISCHLYDKIDEDFLRSECKDYGLDFDDLVSKERPQVLRIGWVMNSHGRWYYSSNGKDWSTGWHTLGGDTYYLGDLFLEYAYTGWNKIDGVWYHFNENTCALDKSTIIDGYTINEQGQALGKLD